MAHAGHILIPDPHFALKHWERIEEERYPKKVWKRPWLEQPKTKGKVLDVTNKAVLTAKGFKSFTPLQVALMALDEARNTDCDQIRVRSPHLYGRTALKATADKVYRVRDLIPLTSGTVLAPRVGHNTVRVDPEGESSALARRWQLTEEHVFAPTV